jgi:hypothetical protein
MDMLLPDIPIPPRRFEITVTVPRGDDGPLVPGGIPSGDGIVCVATARQIVVAVAVDAASMPDAAGAGIAAAGDWAMMPGAVAEVRPVPRAAAGTGM